jgi:myo-inositol-1(or 4)-monophosphatase
MLDYTATLTIATAIAREAGALLMDGFGRKIAFETKSSAIDFVTEYDKSAEKLITEHLTTTFPSHGLIGEEGASKEGSSDYRWYIDPLDGTNNFAHGLPVFCVSLALYKNDVPIIAVIYQPVLDELFTAIIGQGAYLDFRGKHSRMSVSSTDILTHSMVATGFPYDHQWSEHNNVAQLGAMLRQVQGIRRAGSAALDMAYVAAGRLDGYWEFKLHSWDVAAGVLLVQEAGGLVTHVDGTPYQIAPRLALIASNNRIHDAIQSTLATVAIPV